MRWIAAYFVTASWSRRRKAVTAVIDAIQASRSSHPGKSTTPATSSSAPMVDSASR